MRFIDLFAGIGGFRLGFEKAGFSCVFSSEWNKFARESYEANFGETPAGDIRDIEPEDLPEFDLLVAGFPCQPFSIAGVSKKQSLGRAHGFLDQTQGTLFFEIARILKARRPPALLLENVKNLISHNRGATFATIQDVLESLGYKIQHQVINAAHWVPQKRERVFIAGFLDSARACAFRFPEPGKKKAPIMQDILESSGISKKYILSDHLWKYLQAYKKKHQQAGNGFGYGLVELKGQARTLSARYYKDGSEILIPVQKSNPRRLTPRECARLMGFPDSYKIVVSDTQAYKQFGNSVAVPVVRELAREFRKAFSQAGLNSETQSARSQNSTPKTIRKKSA